MSCSLRYYLYLPTKVAVSTSILSKQWEFRWMWLPKLEYCEVPTDIDDTSCPCLMYVDKTLPLHRASVIESLHLRLCNYGLLYSESIKQCIGTLLVSGCLRELSICLSGLYNGLSVLLPTSLYTCKSLVTLKLECHRIGNQYMIYVDVPQMVCLPSLKTLQLRYVTYSNKDSLLSQCLVLEDLVIERDRGDNLEAIVVTVPSLQRLYLWIGYRCSYDGYVIVTPSLKYFRVKEHRHKFSYSFDYMPELEEANIIVVRGIDKLLESLTSVKRLSVSGVYINTAQESVYDRAGIVYNQLRHVKLSICTAGWSKLLVWLIRNSPKLRVLDLSAATYLPYHEVYQPVSWEKSPVPECLLKSLNTFKFAGYKGRPEERDFLCFLLKNACCLKSTSIFDHLEILDEC